MEARHARLVTIARSKEGCSAFRASYHDQTGASGFCRFMRKIVENFVLLRILSFGACVVSAKFIVLVFFCIFFGFCGVFFVFRALAQFFFLLFLSR